MYLCIHAVKKFDIEIEIEICLHYIDIIAYHRSLRKHSNFSVFVLSFSFLVILGKRHKDWEVPGFTWIMGKVGSILDYDKTYFDNFHNIFVSNMEDKLEKVEWYISEFLNIEENL